MRVLIFGVKDFKKKAFQEAQESFVRRIVKHKAIPSDTQITTLSKRWVTLPDVNNPAAVQPFLTPLLNRIGIDPYACQLEWEAELYNEQGYMFIIFILRGIGI